MTRQCAVCGTSLPIGLTADALIDLGWAALREGCGPRHYFCPDHSAEEIVDRFMADSKIGRILRGEVPRRATMKHYKNIEHLIPDGKGPRTYVRGHPAIWVYEDNREEVDHWDRPCARCGRSPIEAEGQAGYDACLGHIPGAVSACCGHGVLPPYVEFEDGEVLVGEVGDAIVRCGYCGGTGCMFCNDRGVMLERGVCRQ